MSKNDEFKKGHSPLTDEDKAILDFEGKAHYKHVGARMSGATEATGLSPAKYFQRLNDLVDHPGAAEYNPVLINRLRRVRDKGMKIRNPRG